MNFDFNKLNGIQDNPIPTLRRISLSGTSQPSPYSIEQWLRQQAEAHGISFEKYLEISNEKQKLLRNELEILQTPNQTFEQLGEHLRKVLNLADELSSNQTLSFTQIFPEWSLYESRVNKLATFVQSVEDMSSSIHATIPRTSNLLQDIKGLQNTLDNKLALYGDALTQNGLEWKAMGLPVDDHLLAATKQWLHNLCIDLMEALDSECKKIGSSVKSISELYDLPIGEELMSSILSGLEFVSEASACVGYTCLKTLYNCRTMIIIYGQWISENLSRLHDTVEGESPGKKMSITNATLTKRVDIRYMQLLDNMTQAISCLLILGDLQILQNGPQPVLQNTRSSLENLSSVLVEFTIRAISVIETEKNLKKVTGNIMMNPQATFAYMTELLLAFVDRVVELGGTDLCHNKRMQMLHTYLENVEHSLKS
ncbi:unnamed protein product [Rhizopus stolonifer]